VKSEEYNATQSLDSRLSEGNQKMLAPHPYAALEYWYFKVNAGPLALLVDWIARRRLDEQWMRVSIHSPHKREVLFEKRTALMTSGQDSLDSGHTAGQVGEIAWDLDIDIQNRKWISPDVFPIRLLRMTDMALVSAPSAVFTGWVRHGAQRIELQRAPGMLAHYWGRQLAPEWWWVSANQFDREDVAVECTVFRSGLWGIPARLPMAYLYLRDAGTQKLVTAPPAIARVTGSPENFEIQFRRLGAEPITLKACGRNYGDFGERIINTLVGDLEIWEGGKMIARAQGTAGLERRSPSE
jgi:hypothetical protein